MPQNAKVELNVEFRGINESRSQGIFDDFVGSIDAQLAEDVLTMSGDGVNAREALSGNLLRRFALGYRLHNLRLGLRQNAWVLFLHLLLVDDHLQCALTDIALMVVNGAQGITHFVQWSVLEHDAELVGGLDHAAHEGRRQFVADEYPLRQRKTLTDDE